MVSWFLRIFEKVYGIPILYTYFRDIQADLKQNHRKYLDMTMRHYHNTVWLKWIATLCSRYASPPPIWQQFCSSFTFVQFSHWTVQIWNMSNKELKMKGYIHIYEICTLFSSFGQKMYGQKVLNNWPFWFFGLTFSKLFLQFYTIFFILFG